MSDIPLSPYNNSDAGEQIYKDSSDRKMVSLRLTRTARQLLKGQADQQGISQSAIVERLLRAEVSDVSNE